METAKLRNKLIEQFSLVIQDDSKLVTLDGIFDSINALESDSSVPEVHYAIVEERRRKRLAAETKGLSWDEVKFQLKQKYGF